MSQFSLGFNFRFPRTSAVREIQDCARKLFDVMTEISESAKLAEEYHCKIVQCSARIESCVGQVHNLMAKLSTSNTQLAAASQQSLGVGADSLLSVERTNRPIGSVGAAIQEVESLKVEQMQLSRHCDRLLAFFRNIGDDVEPVSDEVLNRVADGVNASRVDTNVGQRMASEATVGHANSAADVMILAASDTRSRERVVRRNRSTSVAAVGRVAYRRERNSAANRKSVVGDGHGTVNGSTSSISQTSIPAAAVPVPQSSVEHNRAQFKSPQARARGRPRTRQDVTARANSVDNSLRSLPSDSSELASGTEKRTEKSRGRRRAKSAAQDGAVGSVTAHHNNVDTLVSSNSVDDLIQSAVHSYPLQPASTSNSQSEVKARRRKRTKSATLDGVVENDVGNLSSSNSAENSAQSYALSHQSGQAGSSQHNVIPRRHRRTISAAQSDAGNNTAAVAADNVALLNSAQNTVQSAVRFGPPHSGSNEPEPVKTQNRRRSKSVAFTEQSSGGSQIDGMVRGVSRRARSSRQNINTADGDVPHSAERRSEGPRIFQSAGRRRNYNRMQSPSATRVAAALTEDDSVAITGATSPTSPQRPVTTYLSGPRTDIFRHCPQQSSPSAAEALTNGMSPGADAVDDEVTFRRAVSAPLSATRYARHCCCLYLSCQCCCVSVL